MNRKLFGWFVIGVGSLFLFTSCAKRQTLVAEKVVEEEPELDIHDKEFSALPGILMIHFEYDSFELTPQARKILADNARYLKNRPELQILTEGHCDERGTTAYNLALGQHRAMAVRQYYASLGVDPNQIGTVSYGKEKPLCMENGDACWNQNRRVETKVRFQKTKRFSKQKTPHPKAGEL